MSYRVDKLVIDAHTDGHKHRQTQAMTNPEGQNWPRVTKFNWHTRCTWLFKRYHPECNCLTGPLCGSAAGVTTNSSIPLFYQFIRFIELPVKYVFVSRNLTDTFATLNISLKVKSSNEALGTPTPAVLTHRWTMLRICDDFPAAQSKQWYQTRHWIGQCN